MENKEEIFRGILKTISEGKSNLFSDWENIVSEDLKRHSKIKEIDKGIVKVVVSHSGSKNLLQMECPKLIYKINKIYPELKIKRISIFTDPSEFKEKYKNEISDKYLKDDPKKEEKRESWDLENVSNLEFREFLKKLQKRGEDGNGES